MLGIQAPSGKSDEEPPIWRMSNADARHALATGDKLAAAKTLLEARSIYDKAIKHLGFQYFTYHVVSISGIGGHLPYFCTTYPDEWINHYIAEDYVKLDPVVNVGPKQFSPFLWDEVAQPRQMQVRQKKFFSEAADFSISRGLSIPIHGHRGEFAMMSVVPQAPPRVAAEILSEHRQLVHLLALHYHHYAGRLVIPRSDGPHRRTLAITKRERECLQWIAAGKSAWDISRIIGVSEACVIFHVGNAKRKLGAVNRTHAVVKAFMLGLITID